MPKPKKIKLEKCNLLIKIEEENNAKSNDEVRGFRILNSDQIKSEDAPSGNVTSMETENYKGTEGLNLVKNEPSEHDETFADTPLKMSNENVEGTFQNDSVKVDHYSPLYNVTPMSYDNLESSFPYKITSENSDKEEEKNDCNKMLTSDDTIQQCHSDHVMPMYDESKKDIFVGHEEYEDANSTSSVSSSSSDCVMLCNVEEVYSVSSSNGTISEHSPHYETEHTDQCVNGETSGMSSLNSSSSDWSIQNKTKDESPLDDEYNYYDDMNFTSGLQNRVEYNFADFEKCTRRSQEIVLLFYRCMNGDRRLTCTLYDKSSTLFFNAQKFDGLYSIAYFYLNLPKTDYQINRIVSKLTNEVITLCGFGYEVKVQGTLKIGEEISKWFHHKFIIAEYDDRCIIVYESLEYIEPVFTYLRKIKFTQFEEILLKSNNMVFSFYALLNSDPLKVVAFYHNKAFVNFNDKLYHGKTIASFYANLPKMEFLPARIVPLVPYEENGVKHVIVVRGTVCFVGGKENEQWFEQNFSVYYTDTSFLITYSRFKYSDPIQDIAPTIEKDSGDYSERAEQAQLERLYGPKLEKWAKCSRRSDIYVFLFYQFMDENRERLFSCYNETSTLTFLEKTYEGPYSIQAFYYSIAPTKHKIKHVAIKLIPEVEEEDAKCYLIEVLGIIMFEGDTYKWFKQKLLMLFYEKRFNIHEDNFQYYYHVRENPKKLSVKI